MEGVLGVEGVGEISRNFFLDIKTGGFFFLYIFFLIFSSLLNEMKEK